MLTIDAEQGGFFLLYVPDGTGKIFLILLILIKTQSQKKIVSSGIAATLLDSGRMAHSTLLFRY